MNNRDAWLRYCKHWSDIIMIDRLCLNCVQCAVLKTNTEAGQFCPKHSPPQHSQGFVKGIRELREWNEYAKTCKHFDSYK